MLTRSEKPASVDGHGVSRTTSSVDLDTISGRAPSVDALLVTNRTGFDLRTAKLTVARGSGVRDGTAAGK